MNTIFPSTLIISPSANLAEKKLQELLTLLKHPEIVNNPDILSIDESTGYKIEQIRQIKSFLSKKPISHNSKIIIIKNAHNLLIDSQNTLLKTLEDPGEGNYLILTTSKTSALLPTIVSRCQLVHLATIQTANGKLITSTGSLPKDLLLSETLSKDKAKTLPLLEEQLILHHQNLIKNPSLSKNIAKLIIAIKMINANVDPRSALDYFFLSIS